MNARFKECRKNANLSQKEVASALNVSVQAVSYWENGARMPSHEKCIALAALYNVTVDYLLGADQNQSAITFPGVLRKGKSNAIRYVGIDMGDGELAVSPSSKEENVNIGYTNNNQSPEVVGSIMDYRRNLGDSASIRRNEMRAKLKEEFNLLVNQMNDEQMQQFDLFIKLMRPKEK